MKRKVIGIAPATHWMMIAPKQFREKIQWGILGMFSSYGVGLFFYVILLTLYYTIQHDLCNL